IARIANVTTFAGRKLLDGSLDYVTSGIDTALLSDVNVLAAKFGSRAYIPVEIDVSTSAQKAELTFAAAGIGSQAVTVTVQGPKGIVTLQFPASAPAAQIITQINTEQEATGVTASAAVNPSPPPTSLGVLIQSEGYGTKEFVSIKEVGVPTGAFPLLDGGGVVTTTRQFGVDAAGTINGAPTIGDGLILKLNSSLLDLEVTLDETFGDAQTSFAITSGGSLFQLGPEVNTNQQENIGVKSMQPSMLGNRLV
ncbi:MAG: hypothetical protein GY778_00660, partial [bacterium]|nr:hypothetical protein [bacterium]